MIVNEPFKSKNNPSHELPDSMGSDYYQKIYDLDIIIFLFIF